MREGSEDWRRMHGSSGRIICSRGVVEVYTQLNLGYFDFSSKGRGTAAKTITASRNRAEYKLRLNSNSHAMLVIVEEVSGLAITMLRCSLTYFPEISHGIMLMPT